MKQILCEQCIYWQRDETLRPPPADIYGQCRINPPVIGPKVLAHQWPWTRSTDWCGMAKSKKECE